MNVAYNMDCLEAMREMPDNAFDLSVVDPPYGDGRSQSIHVERERELNLNGTVLVGDSTNTSITRTGGTWAEKYGKKS